MKLRNLEQVINENEGFLTTDIQLSNTKIKDLEILKLVNVEPNYFMKLDVMVEKDNIQFCSSLAGYTKLSSSELGIVDSTILAYNILRFFELENSMLKPVIHPDNIVLDINNNPYLFYRGLTSQLEPEEYDYDELLFQAKCLILALIDQRLSYDNLYNGQLELSVDTDLKKSIVDSNSIDEIKQLLLDLINNQKIIEYNTKVFVNRKKYSMYKSISIIFVILSVVLGAVSGYGYLVESPKQNSYIKANDMFVNKDYSAVIDALSKYDVDKLPKAQKQILAEASVRVLSLSNEQKKVVLNSITASTNDPILNAWILLGRGDYEKAIDNAIKANDLNLQAYALIRYRDAVLQDKNLTGSQIKEKVDKLDKEIKEVQDKINGVER